MRMWFFRAKIFNNKFLPTAARLWAALLVITMLPGSAFAQGPIEVKEELQISPVDNNGFQAISGDIVVFDKNNDIYSYDLSTDTVFRITDQAASQCCPDVSGDTIVWMDLRNGNWDIYGYDLNEGNEFPITSHAADQKWPAIDGNTVVWVDWRNGGDSYGGYDFYGYDLASGMEFRIPGYSAPIVCLAISGNVVVWSEYHFESEWWGLYRYDLGSGTETQIIQGWAPSPYYPAISKGVIVLGGGNSVIGIDLSGNLLFETATLSYPFYGRPAIDGNLVVWQERLVGVCLTYPCASTIVGYDVTSRHKFLIPRGIHEAWYPATSGDVVVWREYGTAFEPDPPSPPPAVYVSKLLETVQLSVSSQFVDPGDVLTYTIALAEATTTSHKRITDSLSSFVTLDVPSLSVTSGNYGYDPATHVVTWTGDVSSDNPITITYNVTVNLDASLGEHITNTVIISDQTSVFSRTVSSWVGRPTYLPIILKNYSP